MAATEVPAQISARGRLHLSPDHGPSSPDAASAALLHEIPAWTLDSNGNIQAANRLALGVWDLAPRSFQGVNVFDVFADNVDRLAHLDNDIFWRAKFRVEHAISPDGLPVFRALRQRYPRLDSIHRMMQFEGTQDRIWEYIIRIDDPANPRQTLDFRTTVSLILTDEGAEVGFLAEYDPLPGSDQTRARLDEMRNEVSAAGSAYVLGDRVELAAEYESSKYTELPGQQDDLEVIEEAADPLPASPMQIASVALLSILSLAVPITVLLLGADSDAQVTPIIFVLFVLGALVSIGAVARSAVYRSDYKARAMAVLMDLRGALREGLLVIPMGDDDARAWLDQLLEDGRDYRDGLIIANCRELAVELDEAVHTVTAVYIAAERSDIYRDSAASVP